jgi:fatty-acyl-CoA synthase
MPQTSLPNAVAYEDWMAEADGNFKWVEVEENDAAGMCYTSGTTGNPKGVVYSHRSNTLHSIVASLADVLGLASKDVVLPVVPLFHANSWSLAFSAPMTGASLIMPGAKLDGASIYELLDKYKVSVTAAVPTVWMMLLAHLEQNNLKLPHLERVLIGGSACPRTMMEKFQNVYDVEVKHAWGMTEMSPIGTCGPLKPEVGHLTGDAKLDIQEKQGFSIFTVDMKITDDENNELPWDGVKFGRLKVRGPAVASAYFKNEGGNILDKDGFFDTGDVATIDPMGYMKITDRAKDVIKSGGEWISSIDLENIAVGHPDVAEAAVIGIAHPKWDERPLLIVIPKKDKKPTREDILKYMEGKIAKWWMPDDVIFVDEIPHTATGKILKTALREKFVDYRLPSVAAE